MRRVPKPTRPEPLHPSFPPPSRPPSPADAAAASRNDAQRPSIFALGAPSNFVATLMGEQRAALLADPETRPSGGRSHRVRLALSAGPDARRDLALHRAGLRHPRE